METRDFPYLYLFLVNTFGQFYGIVIKMEKFDMKTPIKYKYFVTAIPMSDKQVQQSRKDYIASFA